ncbi:hypothetical protein [Allosphingosinicella sp.]|jgi:hypothetical protein
MINFDNIRRTAAAAIGALILSTACIGAAIGPVQADVPVVQSA